MAWNPGERDIVCGRLMGFYNHVGNRRFRKLVDYHVDDSVLAHAEMHTKSIMDILLHSGYRFVRISHHGEIEPAPPNEPVSMVQTTLFRQAGSYSEHLQLNLKTRQELMNENIDLMSYVESIIPWPDDVGFETRGNVGAQQIQNQNEKMNNGRKGESNETEEMDTQGVAPCPTAPTEENTASMLSTLASLRSLDVCLGGKGIAFNQHDGNKRFQQLLNSYSQSFSEAITDGEKSDVRNKIMDKLEKCGYRFVRIEGTGNLTVLSYATVRRKLLGMLRRICQEKKAAQTARQQDLSMAKLKEQFDIQRDQELPSMKRTRYVTAINNIVVPAMQNGILPLKGYWKFFPLPELGNKVDLGGTPSGWKLRLEPISFEAESIILEVPSLEQSEGYQSVPFNS